MLCALLVSSNEATAESFRTVALDFGCVLKVAQTKEEYYDFAADTPFTAIFLDGDELDDNICEDIAKRFNKTKIYLFLSENKNNVNYKFPVINSTNEIKQVFSELLPQFENRPFNILSSIRVCKNAMGNDFYKGKRFLAIYSNNITPVVDEILSAFPVELLPDAFDVFTDGSAVYALLDAAANTVNRICYHVIFELHNVNISAFAVFTDAITDFENACQLFADLGSYAVKLRLENNNNDICYYNNEMHLLEPFGNIIKKAQATGYKIRTCKNDAKIGALIEGFFNQTQLSGATIVNMQFLVCEILRSAFDEDVLYNNLFAVISSKSSSELKQLLTNVCAKEKIRQGDLEVSSNERIIRQICDIIENEYASELYLDRVAEQIYLSPAYISRIFKKSTGMNFVKYLNDVRLKKAAALLIEDDYPINEISKKVGFSDVSYFCSCFKKKYGMTTVQYRRAYILKEIEA